MDGNIMIFDLNLAKELIFHLLTKIRLFKEEVIKIRDRFKILELMDKHGKDIAADFYED